MGALLVGTVVSLIKDGKNGWGWKGLYIIGTILVFFLLAGLTGGRGAFGGGFSGGRGSTGSW
jgi:hypothetical protein